MPQRVPARSGAESAGQRNIFRSGGLQSYTRIEKAPAMVRPINSALNFWQAVTRHWVPARPKVVLHDPAARRPHDLDDPFFDEKVQIRMGDLIAHAADHH
jgi:hypothetical protein